MRKLFVGLFAAASALTGAAALNTPTLYQQQGYMAGYINFCFKATEVDTSTTLEVEVKPHGADDSAYVLAFTKAASTSGSYGHNYYNGHFYRFATNLVGQIDVRVRFTKDGDASAWQTLDKDIKGYPRLTGTVIGTNPQRSNGFDGNMFSVCDGAGTVGYDFGEPKRIKGIRWFARPDNGSAGGGYGSACFNRILGSTFEYANDESFSDLQTILTCTAAKDGGNTSPYQVNEYWFDTPVTARYIRYMKGGTVYGGLNEFEVIPADCPYKPVATVTRSDITNFWPVVSWTYQAGLDPSEVRVERSTAPTGPFAPVSDWMAAGTGGCFTNDTQYSDEVVPFVGLRYYYRVVAKTGHPFFIEEGVPQQVPSAVVDYRRYRRLERAWGAESKLLSSVDGYMKGTNGVSLSVSTAFDGNPNTFPDQSGAYNKGPLGLRFKNRTSIGMIGYQCRNNNYCYARILNTALYTADPDDTELLGKVKRSDYVSQASQDTTYYTMNVSDPTENGEYCWFLYATRAQSDGGAFCLNVAELMFFGWDATDIVAAGVVIAPKAVSFASTGDHLGVVLSWDEGSNADDGYDVERRTRGSEDPWTKIGETAAGVTTYTDTTMTQGYWDYRVVAKKGGQTAATEAFTRPYYVPGEGTGLKRIVYWPFSENDLTFNVTSSNEFANGAVDFDFADGSPICTDGPASNMFLACEGKLIVPFAGSYVITHETSDGGSVWIDGVSAGPHWSGSGKTASGTYELSVGEHDIQVYTRIGASNVGGRRKGILRWSGPVAEEVIPASQFKPAANFYSFGINADYDYRQYRGNDWGRMTVNGSTVTLRGTPAAPQNRGALNVACAMMKGKSPYCELEFSVANNTTQYKQHGRSGVIVRAENGNALMFAYDTDKGSGYGKINCYAVTNGVNSLVKIAEVTDPTYSHWRAELKLVYVPAERTFYGKYKFDASDANWTQLFAFPNNGNFTRESQLGFFVNGTGAENQSGSFTINLKKYHQVGDFFIFLR